MGIPQKLGKYQIKELLGQGGFATVYKAENRSLGTEVVLKVMNAALTDDKQFIQRFEREAHHTARLDHPNIVRVLDMDQVDNQLFIVMEYIPGHTLRELLTPEKLMPFEQVIAIIRQLAQALDYAHAQGLVHRDVKPNNVLVRPDGMVKLADFGIVKATEGTQFTSTGTIIGTPAYMSPEQVKGGTIDKRTDLYALGVVAYEMVTGRVPFQGDTLSVTYKHVHEPPPLPSSISPRAVGSLEMVLLKALAKESDERYQSGAELVAALESAVFELQDKVFVAAYHKATGLLQNQQYAEALQALETLQAMQPDYRDVPTLMQQAQQGMKLAELYTQASEYLNQARQIGLQIIEIAPQFPDPQQVLETVLNRQKPAVKEPDKTRVRPLAQSLPTPVAHVAASETKPVSRILAYLQVIGLTLTLSSYFGAWVFAVKENWGTGWYLIDNPLSPDWIVVPFVAVAGWLLFTIIEYFLPKGNLGIVKLAILIIGAAMTWTLRTEFNLQYSSGFGLAMGGLILAVVAEGGCLVLKYGRSDR